MILRQKCQTRGHKAFQRICKTNFAVSTLKNLLFGPGAVYFPDHVFKKKKNLYITFCKTIFAYFSPAIMEATRLLLLLFFFFSG